MKKRSSAVLALAFVIAASCGGAATPTGTTPSLDTATRAPVASGAVATGGPSAGGATFGQILSSARVSEYKVTYRTAMTGGGEQSWYSKPPKTRYDFSTTAAGQTSVVSIYSIPPEGTFMCFGGTGIAAQCLGMTGLDTALQQNPAALYQQSMLQHPELFSAVLVETRQIAGQQAHCFDVKSTTPVAGATDGRFCYSAQGIMLMQKFGASLGALDMEATNLSLTVPDSDFVLPSKPTILGKP
ncbi:MAG TPA: hypothetical protein VJ726_03540 [Candidatus Limnocylindria bacterium]|nr:hypothetical protein [Candidatus Limnocylindria bacterium]